MSAQKSPTNVLWVQTFGCLALIAMSWADEWLQMPAVLFRGPHLPPSWREAASETVVVILVWLVMRLITKRLVSRLRYLEEFLRVCAWCRKIHLEGNWVPLEEYMAKGLDMRTSHGICPSCAAKQHEEIARMAAGGAAAGTG
jgi:hypothetical protein